MESQLRHSITFNDQPNRSTHFYRSAEKEAEINHCSQETRTLGGVYVRKLAPGWLLICQSASKFVARQVVSLMNNEQQSQNLLHKVDPRSTLHNNFLQSATNVFVARQVDYARWKTGNIYQNLQRNYVARQVEGFCMSYFVFRCLNSSVKRKRSFKLPRTRHEGGPRRTLHLSVFF